MSPMQPKCRKILISACLYGSKCRYDGHHKHQPEIIKRLNSVILVPFCPEEVIFGTPRPPADLIDGDGHAVLRHQASVQRRDGCDVSIQFIEGAQRMLACAQEHAIEYAVLKEKSPSCAPHEALGIRKGGSGVAAALLRTHGITVVSEHDVLNDALPEFVGKSS